MKFHRVIAIDGPAASGKSSVARELARRLDFTYVNSGAMYRAVTWHVLRSGLRPDDAEGISALIRKTSISCHVSDRQSEISIEDIDPAPHLRDDTVNNAVSKVSIIADVRKILTEKMRDCARAHDVVVEGRDIGSVVFPDTPFKFYIDASPEVRVRRRAAEGLLDEITTRDHVDSSRHASPLTVSKDAHVIDSSELTIDGVVGEIIGRLREKGLPV